MIVIMVYAQEEITGIDVDPGESSSGSVNEGLESESITSSSPQPLKTIASELGMYWDSIIFSIIAIAAAISIYFIIRYALQKSADSLNIDRRQLKGINSILKLIIIIITTIIVIFHFSSVSGVAAGAVSISAGTIIGFSSRNTISNAIAGILLLAARPFKLGDKIRITEDESLIGDVIEISLIYTKIRTIRNELVAIPNQTLLQRQIVNYSGFGILKISVNVSMTYNSNRRLIETLLIDSTKDIEGIISSSFHDMDVFQSTGPNKVDDPHVLLTQFNDYSALYELRAYTNNPNEFLRVESEIRKRIYDSFQKHGLDLTIPQAQVDIDSNNKSKKGRNNNSSSNLEDLR